MSVTAVILYLHGFASSPQSNKAAFFAEKFRAHGLRFVCPDFNQPDFRTLTITRMLDQLEREIDAVAPVPVTLIGSSLGGALAVLAATRLKARVQQLVLMAPAVMFAKPGHHLLPPERIEEWRSRGALPFMHYGAGEERLLDYAFYEDSLRYDPFNAEFDQQTIVFQGRHDASVPADLVEVFARQRPRVTLVLVDDDHQLLASLPRIWSDTQAFMGLVD
jgi:uncharacterized protein